MIKNIRSKRIVADTRKVYYEVPREQLLGIAFGRWYQIAAKLYELHVENAENSLLQPRIPPLLPLFNNPMFVKLLYVNYALFRMAISMELKQ